MFTVILHRSAQTMNISTSINLTKSQRWLKNICQKTTTGSLWLSFLLFWETQALKLSPQKYLNCYSNYCLPSHLMPRHCPQPDLDWKICFTLLHDTASALWSGVMALNPQYLPFSAYLLFSRNQSYRQTSIQLVIQKHYSLTP